MPASAFSRLFLICGVFATFAAAASAATQVTSPPDFSGGEGGWVHNLNATFPPVEGSPSPVVQDPGHPFKGRLGASAICPTPILNRGSRTS